MSICWVPCSLTCHRLSFFEHTSRVFSSDIYMLHYLLFSFGTSFWLLFLPQRLRLGGQTFIFSLFFSVIATIPFGLLCFHKLRFDFLTFSLCPLTAILFGYLHFYLKIEISFVPKSSGSYFGPWAPARASDYFLLPKTRCVFQGW